MKDTYVIESIRGRNVFTISMRYNKDKIEKIKQLFISRSYNPDTKQWHIFITADQSEKYIVEVLQNMLISDKQEAITRKSNLNVITQSYVAPISQELINLDDYITPVIPLFKHQKEVIQYLLANNRLLLADQMGLGKTATIIHAALALKKLKGTKRCLIICGLSSLKYNWVDEIKKHANMCSTILGMRQRKRTKNNYIAGGVAILEDLDNIQSLDYFIITNIESMRNKHISNKIRRLCSSGDIDIVAIDEAHALRSNFAKQTVNTVLLKPKHRIAMTGTPVVNTILDLFPLMSWLGMDDNSYYRFKSYYCQLGGYKDCEVLGYKNIENLHKSLSTACIRRLKEDILSLPDKIYTQVYLDMGAGQSRVYKEVLTNVRKEVDLICKSVNPLSALIRLRQATSDTSLISTSVNESIKLEYLKEVLSSILSQGDSVIVYSNFRTVIESAYVKIDCPSKYMITGTTNNNQQSIAEFCASTTPAVVFGTTKCLGVGFTLTKASYVIFLDSPWNDATKEQAIDRVHRIGTSKNVNIMTLICKDTIDERIESIVYDKGTLSDEVLSDIHANRDKLVEYLIS